MPDRCPDWPAEFGFTGGGLPATLDYQALLEGLAWGGYLGGRADDQDAAVAEEAGAVADGRMRRAELPYRCWRIATLRAASEIQLHPRRDCRLSSEGCRPPFATKQRRLRAQGHWRRWPARLLNGE